MWSVDLDEHLQLVRGDWRGPRGLLRATASAPDADVFTFGSKKGGVKTTCHKWRPASEPRIDHVCPTSRSSAPSKNHTSRSPCSLLDDVCPGSRGWRKYLSRAQAVWTASVHEVSACRPNFGGAFDNPKYLITRKCTVVTVSVVDAWIFHNRTGTMGVQFETPVPKGR